jgi:hypothetical protein
MVAQNEFSSEVVSYVLARLVYSTLVGIPQVRLKRVKGLT